jgi:hypothetical protein
MAKNIPITARVSRGLFGQKATEPVLNVGQAGVYGNNVTKGDPSPTKMMMKSPFKQVKSEGAGDKILKGQANVSTGSTGPDKVIKGGSKTTYTPPTHTKEGDAAYAKMSKAQRKAADEKYKKENTKTITTPDQVVPGENTKSTEPLKVFNEGSAKTSFWRRQDDRAVTHTSRKKKKADIQLAKLEAKEKGLTGSAKRDYINTAKTKAKKEMWESRQSGYKGSRDAAVLQEQQSARVHDKVIGVQVDASKEQKLPVSRTQVGEATKYKMHGQMENQTFTGPESLTATASGNVNPATGKPAGGLADTKSADVKAAETPKAETKSVETKTNDKLGSEITVERKTPQSQMTEDDTPLEKKANGFFAKKSPLKMKYFK